MIGDELRVHTDERRAAELAVAVYALNRMLELGRPSNVRKACLWTRLGSMRLHA